MGLGKKILVLLILVFLPVWVLVSDLIVFVRVVNFHREASIEGPLKKSPDRYAVPVDREAIVVLTGDRHRIPRAIELLRLRGNPLLIISGGGKGASLVDVVNQQLGSSVNIHQVWKKIILESHSSSTIENAIETGKILATTRVNRIVLVTSDYHMARASSIFKKINPKYELLEYPVRSDIDSFFNFSSRTWNAYGNMAFEYLKHLSYALYFSHRF